MRPELRKTSYLRNLKAEILKEAGGVDLPEYFEDIKTALEDIYGDDDQKDGLIADVSAIQTVMAEEPENGGVIANILDWRTNGVRKDDLDARTLGDVFLIDDQTDDDEGAYQVPDGTSVVSIDRETLHGEVKLLPPADAPSVILVVQSGGDLDVVKWDDGALNLCPMNLLVRYGAEWVNAPLASAFEYRMKNETFTITGEQGTVEVPAGTGAVVCDGLTDAVTLDMTGSFYPQVIFINNVVGGHAVTLGQKEVASGGGNIFANLGGNWISLGDDE